MKHTIQSGIIALAFLTSLSLASCGNGGEKSSGSKDTSAAAAAAPQVTGKSNVEYLNSVSIPDYSKANLGVYNIPADFKTSEAEGSAMLGKAAKLAGMAPRLSRNKDAGDEKQIWYTMPDDASAINNYDLRNGDLTFNAGMKKYEGADNTPNLVKGDAAGKRAQEYIRQLEIKAGDQEMVLAHTGGVNMGATDGKNSKNFEKFTTVQFRRRLDGIDVFGHSRLVVTMAEGGKLNSLVKQWAPLNKTKVTADQLLAQADAKAGLERAVLSENQHASKISIESITLVYYDDGSGVLEPALRVKGKTAYAGNDPNAKEFTYDTVVPILKSPRMTYPYDHSKLEKRATDKDAPDSKPGERSPDDKDKK